MNNIELKDKIKKLLVELDNMPYGIETHNKILPPSIYHYKQLVDHLINCLLQVNEENVIEILRGLCSIRDNQLRELFVSRNNSFEKYGVNQEMEVITRQIHMYVDGVFSTTNSL